MLSNSAKYDAKKKELVYPFSSSNLEQIRSVFVKVSARHPEIWLSIPQTSKTGDEFFPFEQSISDHIYLSFGCLLSTSKFFIHETPLQIWSSCTAMFLNEQTFVINCSNNQICLTFSMKSIDKTVLVKESDDYSEIIFSIQTITSDVRKTNENER